MKKNIRVMVVDDELIVRESLSGWLKMDGYAVETAASAEDALDLLKKQRFNVMFLDNKMPGMDGLELLDRLKEEEPDMAVIMITAYGSIDGAIKAMKNGAYDYLLKPFDPNEIGLLIQKVIDYQGLAEENIILKDQIREKNRLESLIGQSKAMQNVFNLILDVAEAESNILITGETGTGKELVAKAIHTQSPRAYGPFIAVNCGAFTEHLLESELFGHEKGAFTDAVFAKKGRFELAQGGTLFLDEVGVISMKMQIDLLRVLEEKSFYRVGGTQPIEADFRILSATNRELGQAIQESIFRQDLYYRLNVITIHVPPLRERKEDIPLLANHFLRRFAKDLNKPFDNISRDALDEMMLYDWPGNVRELENAIERAVVVGRGRTIQAENLPFYKEKPSYTPKDGTLKEVEKGHIIEVLEETRWNISKAASTLGIDRVTLYNRIKKYGLKKPSDA
ncbi:MAG: sigma-54-dependent Fis family transcriptional regulator [Deltaproteobacteria bacterium]|nr:sigma-54-dependent Fis family transcriptional regulator [Deltaproteobacteria bacterium]MBW2053597.1 sigma-54-dependent Fis family transcriptional regulator [Deltaproteobacteria bacterium]MBW2140362.1 sigma-54-dependent Fis family transcriptional regulator [Deltaproteobacteria bacterium]MBW2323216.1 sigma-54-dependent Fis family transcriptional regulator [Deltaproteobacteria bacterium]